MTSTSARRFVAPAAGAGFALMCFVGSAACGTSSTGASSPSDAATHRDAAHAEDAAASNDAGPRADATKGNDAGPHADAGKGTDAKSPHDASGNNDSGPVMECSGGCTNGLGCAPGCSVVATCETAGNMCSCDCPDAAVVDGGQSCHPDTDAGCPGYYIPGTCFDAAIPASPTAAQCAAFCGATNIAACGPTLPGGQPGILCASCLQQ